MKFNKSVLLKGSATVVVIFAAITSSIYMVSTFADYEHYRLTSDKYDTHLNNVYNTDNIEKIYFAGLKTMIQDNNLIIQSGPKRYIAKNIIENGSFEQGRNGWLYGSEEDENENNKKRFQLVETSKIEGNDVKNGNYSIKITQMFDPYYESDGTPRDQVSTLGMRLQRNFSSVYNHKYYASCYINQNFKEVKGLVVMRFGHVSRQDAEGGTFVAYFAPVNPNLGLRINNNEWLKCSGIYTNSETNDNNPTNYSYTTINIWCFRTENTTGYSVPSVDDYFYVDNVMVIDLTETFGAGNEPDLEWCEKNISFFDGYKQLIK